MSGSEPDTRPGPFEDAAWPLQVLGQDERASFHRLHVTIAAEKKANSCRTCWSILRILATASADDLQKFADIYASSVAEPDGSEPRLAIAEAARAPELGGGDGRLAQAAVRESRRPEYTTKAPRYCDVCKIWCNGKTQYEDHLAGNKHTKNLSAEAPTKKPASEAGERPRLHPQVYQ